MNPQRSTHRSGRKQQSKRIGQPARMQATCSTIRTAAYGAPSEDLAHHSLLAFIQESPLLDVVASLSLDRPTLMAAVVLFKRETRARKEFVRM